MAWAIVKLNMLYARARAPLNALVIAQGPRRSYRVPGGPVIISVLDFKSEEQYSMSSATKIVTITGTFSVQVPVYGKDTQNPEDYALKNLEAFTKSANNYYSLSMEVHNIEEVQVSDNKISPVRAVAEEETFDRETLKPRSMLPSLK